MKRWAVLVTADACAEESMVPQQTTVPPQRIALRAVGYDARMPRSAALSRRIFAIASLGAGVACHANSGPFESELEASDFATMNTRDCFTKAQITAAADAGATQACPPPAELTRIGLFSATPPNSMAGANLTGGPVEWKGDCCYLVSHWHTGRPFVVAERARRAGVTPRSDWAAVRASRERATPRLTAVERSALAAAWLEDARMEHASIASFARFSLELLSVGAPAGLVAEACRGALDEIEHARLSFALASRYGGAPCGPGALDVTGVGATRGDLVALAVAAVREGCVGETEAALVAQAQLHGARDPFVRRALTRIATDEARHAELAWRFVAWAVREGGARLEVAVARALDEACRASAATTVGVDPDARVRRSVWRTHGRLEAADIERVRAEAREAIVARARRMDDGI